MRSVEVEESLQDRIIKLEKELVEQKTIVAAYESNIVQAQAEQATATAQWRGEIQQLRAEARKLHEENEKLSASLDAERTRKTEALQSLQEISQKYDRLHKKSTEETMEWSKRETELEARSDKSAAE